MAKISFPAGGAGGGSSSGILVIESIDGPTIDLIEGSGIQITATEASPDTIQFDVGGGTVIHSTVSGTTIGAASQVYISGIPVGDNLGQGGSSDGSGIGRIIDGAGNEITPSELTIVGSGGTAVLVSGSDAVTIYIPDETFLPFSSGENIVSQIITDHGNLAGLQDDDHEIYLLGDASRDVSGILTPDNSGIRDLGSESRPFAKFYAISGIFGSGTTIITGENVSGITLNASSQVNISGLEVGDRLLSSHSQLSDLTSDDHTQYLLREDFASSGVAGGIPLSGTTIGASDQVYISGVPVGDNLGQGDGNPVDSRAATGDILSDTDGAYDIGAAASKFGSGYFVLVSGITVSGTNTGASSQSWISGIPVGNRLYTESEISSLAEEFVEGGTANPLSGVNVGAATQIYVSGTPIGDFLSEHTADTALDNRAATGDITSDADGAYDIGSASSRFGSGHFVLVSGTTTSGIDAGVSSQLYVSGVPVGDRLYTESEVTSLAETFVEGGTANPVSGVNVGASSQIYISGVPVGDNLGQGGGSPVDSRAVTGNIFPDTHQAYNLGGFSSSGFHTIHAGSGYFNATSAFTNAALQVGSNQLVVRATDGRVGISTSSLNSVLNLGGDRIINFIGGNGQIAASAGILTLTDGSYLNFSSSSIRTNTFDGGGLVNIRTNATTKPSLAIRATGSQTAKLIALQNSAGNDIGGVDPAGSWVAADASGASIRDVLSLYHDATSAQGAGAGTALSFYADNTSNSKNLLGDIAFYAPVDAAGFHVAHAQIRLNNNTNQQKAVVSFTPSGIDNNVDILPSGHQVQSVGRSNKRFKEIHATSGHIASGIVMTAPNGSGWLLHIDNSGILTTSGPFVV